MKWFTHIPGWLKNKYTLSLIAFVVWMLFFDDRSVMNTYFRQRSELNGLKASKAYYQEQIISTQKELDQLKVNTTTIEKYAREKYLMKRDNEDLFLLNGSKKSK
jgi:cell division protein DivIC